MDIKKGYSMGQIGTIHYCKILCGSENATYSNELSKVIHHCSTSNFVMNNRATILYTGF